MATPPHESGSRRHGTPVAGPTRTESKNSSTTFKTRRQLSQLNANNRPNLLLRECILHAAILEGGGSKSDPSAGMIRYLRKAARRHPVAFLGLLGRVLPLQVQAHNLSQITVEIVKRDGTPTTIQHSPAPLQLGSPPLSNPSVGLPAKSGQARRGDLASPRRKG